MQCTLSNRQRPGTLDINKEAIQTPARYKRKTPEEIVETPLLGKPAAWIRLTSAGALSPVAASRIF
jgi:hypothetical protein